MILVSVINNNFKIFDHEIPRLPLRFALGFGSE
jgi:hypothetical protein